MKRCGLYIRVSTERQAKVQEGSLKAQNELLTRHVEMKNKLGGDEWAVVDRYVDEGRSAKDIQGRPEYLRMMDDIRHGRINAVMCIALSRISRSTRDLLEMIDFFKKVDVDFICLKEDFDTTTAQGKCFVTIMGALNEFEREQTSERTKLVLLARGERGLWHAGPILGYDRPPDKKGHLVPNPAEAAVVNAAFDTYLDCGSILKTCEFLTAKGYRTKEYVTQTKQRLRPGRPFVYTSMQNLLTNPAYIGKREINKRWRHQPQDKLPETQRYKVVDGIWDPIVPPEQFERVQALLRHNLEHKRNEVRPTRHIYLLNGGFLFCDQCGSRMEGSAAYGHRGTKAYYYYVCDNTACRFKLPEGEVERMLRELIRHMGAKPTVMAKVVAKLNARLQEQLPKIAVERRTYEEELRETNRKAQRFMENFVDANGGGVFLKETLDQLAARRRTLEGQLAMLAATETDITERALSEVEIQALFQQFDRAFSDSMQPYQRRELVYRVLRRVELSKDDVRLGIDLSQQDAYRPDTAPVLAEASRPPHRPGEFSSCLFVTERTCAGSTPAKLHSET